MLFYVPFNELTGRSGGAYYAVVLCNFGQEITGGDYQKQLRQQTNPDPSPNAANTK